MLKYGKLLALTAILVVLYGYTLAPSLVELDSGELATAQALPGIAHPTGYPLFTMLGYLFLRLPLGMTPVHQSNLFAMLCTLGGVFFFYASLRLIFRNLGKMGHPGKAESIPAVRADWLAFWGALIYATSRTIWLQSTSVEVYSLHILILNATVWYLLRLLVTDSDSLKLPAVIPGIMLGLGFANHLSIVYVLPAFALAAFLKAGAGKKILTAALVTAVTAFVTAALLYSYLFIRSSQSPALNWGVPSSLDSFFYHISGMQFRRLAFSEKNYPMEKLWYFLSSLFLNPVNPNSRAGEFGLLIFPGIFGVYVTWKRYRRLFFVLITMLLTTLFFSINYRINDIDAYFILAFTVIAVCITAGLHEFYRLTVRNELGGRIAAAVLGLLTVMNIAVNLQKVNQNNVYIYEDFTREVLAPVQKNAVLLCSDQDPFVATTYYHQHVLNERPDILKIVVPFLAEEWYADWLNQLRPGIARKAGGKTILNTKDNPVYLSLGVFGDTTLMRFLGADTRDYIPDGYLFRPVGWTAYLPSVTRAPQVRFTGRRTEYTDMIEQYIIAMLYNRLQYEYQFQKEDRIVAIQQILRSLKIRVTPDIGQAVK